MSELGPRGGGGAAFCLIMTPPLQHLQKLVLPCPYLVHLAIFVLSRYMCILLIFNHTFQNKLKFGSEEERLCIHETTVDSISNNLYLNLQLFTNKNVIC